MTEFIFAYVVAIFAMLLSASSGLTLIYAVNHFDPPETRLATDKNAHD